MLWQLCVGRHCPGETTLLLTASPLFGDQCLLHFGKGRCSNWLWFLHSFQSSQPAVSHLCPTKQMPSPWMLISVFETFWVWWTTVSALLRLFFCLWVIKIYPCFIHYHKSSQETCCVPSQVPKDCLWSLNVIMLLICILTSWLPSGRKVRHVQHIMDGEPHMFLRYLCGWNFLNYQIM